MSVQRLLNDWIIAWEYKNGKKFSAKEFASTNKLNTTYFSRVRTGDIQQPGTENIRKIAQGFGVSLSAFLNGPPTAHPSHHIDSASPQGPFDLSGAKSTRDNDSVSIAFVGPEPEYISGEDVQVSYFTVKASAGGGVAVVREDTKMPLSFKSDWIRRALKASPNNLALIKVSGDSMEPTLYNGDVVMLDRSQNELKTDGLYVFRTDDELFVKRIERQLGGRILVKSDNPAYTSYYLENVNTTVFGKVLWRAGAIG